MRILALIALALAAATPLHAAPTEEGKPIIIGRSYTIQSTVLGDTRRINVYLPDDYKDGAKRFPVLYLLDGGEAEDFHHITGIVQVAGAYGAAKQMIVIGIEGVDRRHDMTAPSDDPKDRKIMPTAGGSAAYRKFLVEEVKPWVAARYRTDGHSALIGESLAGLFTVETLLTAPQSFDDYIAISPSLWWKSGALSAAAEAALKTGDFAGRRLWLSQEDEGPEIQATVDQLIAALKTVHPKGISWTYDPRPGERHDTIYDPAATAAIRTLYALPRK